MRKLMADPGSILSNITDYVGKFSSEVREVFERFEFLQVIDGLGDKNLLFMVAEKFCGVDLSPDKVDNSAMGDIYEELIRRFSEMSNETAGEHFSPRDGVTLAVELATAEAKDDLSVNGRIVTVYDPCAGTGGMLSIFDRVVHEYNSKADVQVYGQELNPQTYAICKADLLLKGGDPDSIAYGNTLSEDAFAGRTFGYQLSNPPYGVEWKKVEKAVKDEARELGYAGRFGAGTPRVSDGQLLFVEHMVSIMRSPEDGGGRIAVFLNGSPLFTGAAGSGESEIRRRILENDLLEAIVAMPNDFFNTGIAIYIWILDNDKPAHRKGRVQLINANGIYSKMRKSLGSKRNELTEEQIEQVVRIYSDFLETEICKIFDTTDFGYTTVTVEHPLRDDSGKILCDKKGQTEA